MAAGMYQLLKIVAERGASDLHLTAGFQPMIRVNGGLQPAMDGVLSGDDVGRLVRSVLTEHQEKRLDDERELDLAFSVEGVGRFRGNAHWQRGHVEAAFRLVPADVPRIQDLGLPAELEELCRLHVGLILVTGATGYGKSTTLAAMVDTINRESARVIITVEDPIEYVHTNKLSIIKQREVGLDTRSFAQALRHVLRQDPDVVLVGEMRDLETMASAITAAETGHLVLSTLHTSDAAQTIDRIVDVFPPEQQRQVTTQLANCLAAVLCQQLIPRADGKGRAVAYELLIANAAVRNCIRDHQIHQIPSMLQIGGKEGMITMDACLAGLYGRGVISEEEARRRMKDPRNLVAATRRK